jgi:F-type H+-transporting ATPase subunit alpha
MSRTRQMLERGQRVREVLKQPQYVPLSVPEQIAVLLALVEGVFDALPLQAISAPGRRTSCRAARRRALTYRRTH